LSTHQRLGLLSGRFPCDFPINILHAFLFPHSCYMPWISHPSWLDHSNFTYRRVHVMKLLITQFSPTSGHFVSLPVLFIRGNSSSVTEIWKKAYELHLVLSLGQTNYLSVSYFFSDLCTSSALTEKETAP
jgi:hypothetical protein